MAPALSGASGRPARSSAFTNAASDAASATSTRARDRPRRGGARERDARDRDDADRARAGGDRDRAAFIVIFVAAWVGQFIGHRIEGKKPSFGQDVQFLLIGPAWLLSFIYKRLGVRY